MIARLRFPQSLVPLKCMITTYHRPSQHTDLTQHPDQLLEAQPIIDEKNFSKVFNAGWELDHVSSAQSQFLPAGCKEISPWRMKLLVTTWFKSSSNSAGHSCIRNSISGMFLLKWERKNHVYKALLWAYISFSNLAEVIH